MVAFKDTIAIKFVAEGFEKVKQQVKKVTTEIKNLGKGVDVANQKMKRLSNGFVVNRQKQIGFIAALRHGREGLKQYSQSFNMALLSAMFFGMAMKMVAEQITRATTQTFLKLTEATTTSGQALTRLTANWEYLKFTIGSAIAESLEPLVPRLVEIIQKFTDWVDQNPKLVSGIIGVIGVLGTILFVFGTVGLGIKGVVEVFNAFLGVLQIGGPIFKLFGKMILGTLSLIAKHPAIMILIGSILLLNYAWKNNILGIRDMFYKAKFFMGNLKDLFALTSMQMALYFTDAINKIIGQLFNMITFWNNVVPDMLKIGSGTIDKLAGYIIDTDPLTQQINALGTTLKEGLDLEMEKVELNKGEGFIGSFMDSITGTTPTTTNNKTTNVVNNIAIDSTNFSPEQSKSLKSIYEGDDLSEDNISRYNNIGTTF